MQPGAEMDGDGEYEFGQFETALAMIGAVILSIVVAFGPLGYQAVVENWTAIEIVDAENVR